MPVLHVDHKPGILLHSGIAALEPMIKPAYGLVAPFDLRAKGGIVGEGMVPRADDCSHLALGLHEHVDHVVTIAVLQAAN